MSVEVARHGKSMGCLYVAHVLIMLVVEALKDTKGFYHDGILVGQPLLVLFSPLVMLI